VGVGLLGVVGHGAEGGQVGGEAVAGAGVGRSGGYELKKSKILLLMVIKVIMKILAQS